MDFSLILTSVAILGGVGLTFGGLIALANAKLKVWEDPRIDAVEEVLPGANCGACGLAGCRAFAEAAVKGEVAPAGCTVMGEEDRADVAAVLGVDAGEANKLVARLLCAGGTNVATSKARYHGVDSCAAAVAVTGGGKGCTWGCVSLADCAVACDFEAITMNPFGLPVVEPDLCTSCGDCVDACPLDLFTVMPLADKLIVQCKNLLEGDDAEEVCAVACTACARCVQDAAPGLIEIKNGLAVIDYANIRTANTEATARCPTGAIVWVEGAQFAPVRELVGSEAG
ncbi:MAG: RnfABCDGE type electron transport complex subunit B [Gemmatimonadetes bacterium]|nr:RnfABCDGE type electron transport complex subunit B [Gemmatimonadota bacterium]NNM06167.1 RnfABCDGE type electron transport complex subunit B [Gemmatimonadota bacterium]